MKRKRHFKKHRYYKVDDYFICEICKTKTPRVFEGREPNTCVDCMPFEEDENCEYLTRNITD